MYGHTLVCTYPDLDGDPADKEALYRCQLLQALGMDAWDADKADRTIAALYGKVGEHESLAGAYAQLKENRDVTAFARLFDADVQNDTLFRMLFSFDYFSRAHRLIGAILRGDGDLQTHADRLVAHIKI